MMLTTLSNSYTLAIAHVLNSLQHLNLLEAVQQVQNVEIWLYSVVGC